MVLEHGSTHKVPDSSNREPVQFWAEIRGALDMAACAWGSVRPGAPNWVSWTRCRAAGRCSSSSCPTCPSCAIDEIDIAGVPFSRKRGVPQRELLVRGMHTTAAHAAEQSDAVRDPSQASARYIR